MTAVYFWVHEDHEDDENAEIEVCEQFHLTLTDVWYYIRMGLEMLSPKQKETAEIIFKLTQQEHFPPTLDEIAAQMGITKGTLQYHISALKKKNIITWNQGSARSIRIIDDDSYNYCRDKFSTENDSQAIRKFDYVHNTATNKSFSRASNGKMYRDNEFEVQKEAIPILGQITAGLPLEITNQAEEYLELDSFFPLGCYALKVKGQSMIDALINDGDVVLIEPRKVANNGEIVVALINRESSTLKRFYKQKDGRIMLKPENPYMEPIYLDPTDTLDIQGVVKGVLRRL
jgi:repressor LexA